MYLLLTAGRRFSQPGMSLRVVAVPDFITRELWIYRVFDPYFLSTSLHLDVEAIYVTSATDLF